jgi:hypothetical protein
MNSTGQNEKNGYKVLLLLVVGLTAFSSAMKELNQLQQFSLDASRFIAQLSDKFTATEVPAVPVTGEVKPTVVKVESCEIKQSLPSVDLPWLSGVAHTTPRPAPRAVVPRPSQAIDFKVDVPLPGELEIAKLKKFAPIEIEPVHFDVTVTTPAGPDAAEFTELPVTSFKVKTRNQRGIRINTRDREMFLKSWNRSINLRFAS